MTQSKMKSEGFQKYRLGDLVEFISGGTPSKQRPEYWNGGTLWVSAKDLKSFFISSSIDRLSEKGRIEASLVPKGALLLLVRGMSLFKSIPLGIATRELAINQDLKGLVSKGRVTPEFLAYSLLAREGQLLKMVEAAGHGTGRLDTDKLKDFVLTVPSPDLQLSAVAVLSLWDTAIEKTEQLMVAKERLKVGLMQQLLTGNRRLKGFDNTWTTSHLGDLFSERNEKGNDHLPLLSITREEGVVFRDELDRRDTSSEDKSSYLRICPGDIGYNTMRMWQGVSALSQLEGIVSPAYTVCIPKEQVHGKFIGYLFKLPQVIHLFYRYSQGLTSDTWNLKFSHFAEIKVRIPLFEQQAAIAAVLETADAELKVLKQQRSTLERQKRGFMQKLFTGQWRVKVADTEAA